MAECHYCGLPAPGLSSGDESSAPRYCCYGCRLAAAIAGGGGPAGQAVMTLTRLGTAILLSMNVMVFSTLLYGQHVYDPGATGGAEFGAGTAAVFRYLSLAFTVPVLFLLGGPIAANAWSELRRRRLTTDLLIVVGVIAAFIYSYVSVLRNGDGLYFDTACMTLVLVTLGKYLEATGKLKTTAALRELESLLPAEVTVIIAGEHVSRPTEEVQAGDVVYVRPGGRIPIDGRIAEGQAYIDEQTLTGESEPAFKRTGDHVYAGTLCADGALTLETTAVGRHRVLAGVIDLLTEARRGKGRYHQLADRVAAAFVPVVGVLALFGAVIALRHGVDHAILTGLAVLLISCPCALGLATPMALWVALGRAARHGVLFRNIAALETLAKVRTVCFDKTGTLTTGTPAVSDYCIRGERSHEQNVLALAGGLARAATHHLADGLSRFVSGRGVDPATVTEVRSIAGQGVLAVANRESQRIGLGSPALMRHEGHVCDPRMERFLGDLMQRGDSVACVGWDGGVQAVFGFHEELRPEAPRVVDELQRQGLAIRVLTGDHCDRARRLSAGLGVPVESELLPADKLARLRSLPGPVAMVGDGINDAPALAAADVGLAMGCGADISRESADVCLVGNDLKTLPWAIELSRKTMRVIRWNLVWAFGYNIVGVGLAMTGRLSPVFAAVAMVLSSLLVLTHSLSLGRAPVTAGG